MDYITSHIFNYYPGLLGVCQAEYIGGIMIYSKQTQVYKMLSDLKFQSFLSVWTKAF